MTVKEYLQQYRDLDADITALQNEVENLERRAGNLRPAGAAENVVKRLDETITALADEIQRSMDMRTNIVAIIEGIQNRQEQRVLRYRYINGYSFRHIAMIMNYTRENIFYIHRKALKNVESQERAGKI